MFKFKIIITITTLFLLSHVACLAKEKGQSKRASIPYGAVTPKMTTAEISSASTETTPSTVKPTQTGRTLGQYIRVTETKVDKGKTVTFSLDPTFVEQESQNTKVTYYWSLAGYKAGRKASYVVDTSALDEGMHRVQVGMYKTPTGGTRVVSDGWGMFEVVSNNDAQGSLITYIEHQIVDEDSNEPVQNLPYSISFADGSPDRNGKTDHEGFIYEERVPDTEYYIVFDDFNVQIATSDFFLQVASYRKRDQANLTKGRLKRKGMSSYIQEKRIKGKTWYRVMAGPVDSEQLNYWKTTVTSLGHKPLIIPIKRLSDQ